MAGETPAHYAQRMRAMEVTVRELLAAAQEERKAQLDVTVGRVDTVLQVAPGPGDQVLLRTKELFDAADHDIGKLLLRWDGPFKFTVTACPSHSGYWCWNRDWNKRLKIGCQ